MSRRRLVRAAAVLAGVACASAGLAQRIEAGASLTVHTGPAPGRATTFRLDPARSNVSPTLLPTDDLRVIWTRQARPTEHPPLVQEDGAVLIVGALGDVVVLNPDGTDRSHFSLGSGPTSGPVLLSDGTLVVVDGHGEAVFVRGQTVQARVTVGPPTPPAVDIEPPSWPRGHHRPLRTIHDLPSWADASPLALDDGGVVVAWERQLVCLDARGGVRARASLPAPIASALVSTGSTVAFVAEEEVFEWTPGAEVRKKGSFGGAVEVVAPLAVWGGADVGGPRLVAAVDHARLVLLDLGTGELDPIAASDHGLYVGAPTLAPDGAYIQEMTPSGTRIVRLAPDAPPFPIAQVATASVLPSLDGGFATASPSHSALLVDRAGTVAYGTVDGHVGVATPTSKTVLGDTPCGRPSALADPSRPNVRASAGFAGIVPAGQSAFVVACENGEVVLVRGTSRAAKAGDGGVAAL